MVDMIVNAYNPNNGQPVELHPFHGNGDGTFTAGTPFGTQVNHLLLADFDGDKVLDLAATDWGDSQKPGKKNVHVWKGDGTGKFPTDITDFIVGNGSRADNFDIADLNLDGKLDLLAVGTGQGPDFVSIPAYFGGVDAYLGGAVPMTQAPGFPFGTEVQTATSVPWGSAEGVWGAVSVDINNDGFVDVAATHGAWCCGAVDTGKYPVLLFLSNGPGLGYTKVELGAVDTGTNQIGRGDFDGDGKIDLVTLDGGYSQPIVYLGSELNNNVCGNGGLCLPPPVAGSLVQTHAEKPGANCANGGQKLDFGKDANHDGQLTGNEIAGTTYVCNGTPGSSGTSGSNGTTSLVNVTPENVGENCANGGFKVDSGIDANNDQKLEQSEIASTSFVCNGAAGAKGANGKSTIVTLSDAPTSACPTGGKQILTGFDSNDDGTLTGAEIVNTAYVCNGAAGATGKNGLAQVSTEAPGGNCKAGGEKIESGTDLDGNGKLEGAEIASTQYVCNGQDGTASAAGLSSLLKVSDEPAGKNCTSGGKKVESGLDKNSNGTLDASEVQATTYICSPTNGVDGKAGADGKSGSAGLTSLIKVSDEPTGSTNCASGGKRLDTGIDTNGNGILDDGEIKSTSYLCDASIGGGTKSGGCTASPGRTGATSAIWGLLLAGLATVFLRRRAR